ncbi:MAG TPA: M43 family zinc metalloprotease [Chitinophagaceae bacterium]
MKTLLSLAFFTITFALKVIAQRECSTFSYQQQQKLQDPLLVEKQKEIETFTRQFIANNVSAARVMHGEVIKIPVVFHVLYHHPSENISDAQVQTQLDVLNRCFRRTNADTIKTPSYFSSVAADCEIEFVLAISDPRRRNTNGIIRKYTPITEWRDDDKVKRSSEMGDDAWDARSYLNIWVCNLHRLAGYATMPGGAIEKDGVVLDFDVLGTGGPSGYNMGKTAVHEVGHWLNLKHLWGDDYCGDDSVNDTPRQAGYNSGCPSGKLITCNNGPNGDMYMNYMDFTDDACTNLFTKDQKTRMRSLFAAGGQRSGLLNSTGLLPPLIFESPLPDQSPKWLHPQLYPNPATTEMKLDLAYDTRWIGKIVTITNLQGQTVMQVPVQSKEQTIFISRLKPGMYILSAKKEDGEFILEKFVKF